MPNNTAQLDRVFHALSNKTRRDILERLGHGPASMTELAAPIDMALPSLLQHLQLLESEGLIRSQKTGRVRTYSLDPTPLILAEHWMDTRKKEWETRIDQLDQFLKTKKDKQK